MEKNLVSLTDFKKNQDEKKERAPSKIESFSFEEIMQRNKENHDRLSKERNKANHGVIKSYRLKQ
jgi:hypothetical protein